MSWDKYNEARRKAKEASSKVSKAASGDKTVKMSSSEKKDVKTAYKNAVKYKWLFVIFAILAILACCTLPFANDLEKIINKTIENDGIIVASPEAFSNSELTVNYIDVYQGDCILINLPDGKNMIIDAGSSFNYYNKHKTAVLDSIKTYMNSKVMAETGDSGKIDYMVMTHGDYDHFSYMPDILAAYEVVNIYRPNVYYGYNAEKDDDKNATSISEKQAFSNAEKQRAEERNAKYVTKDMYSANKSLYAGFNVKEESASALYKTYKAFYEEEYTSGGSTLSANVIFTEGGMTIEGTGYKFTFYAPISKEKLYKDWNNYSCMIVMEYKGLKYCFTGDVEAELEKDILETYGDVLPDIDIMDAGHHGSKTSSSQAFLDKLKPEVVICSCDDGSEFGHPTKEAINRFLNVGVAKDNIFTTHLNGNICVGLKYSGTRTEETDTGTITEEVNLPYVVGISKDGEIEVSEIKWWTIVVGFIVLAGLILLVIVPNIIKSVKKNAKKAKK